jgi:hypothetical protein
VFSEQITIFAAVREETAGLEFIHHTPIIEVGVTESSHSSPPNISPFDASIGQLPSPHCCVWLM